MRNSYHLLLPASLNRLAIEWRPQKAMFISRSKEGLYEKENQHDPCNSYSLADVNQCCS